MRKKDTLTLGMAAAFFLLIGFLNAGGALNRSFSGQLVPICVYSMMALSLNLTVGILGELSLGHAGFMSVGAVSGVIAATCLQEHIASPWLLMPLCMLIGAAAAALTGVIVGVPALRLRGDYLAIVTLAFCEIIKNILNCLYVSLDANGLHVSMFHAPHGAAADAVKIVKGAAGVAVRPYRLGLSTYPLCAVMVLLTLLLIIHFTNSREGRAVKAIRDDDIAAQSVGIDVTAYKLRAFVLSAAIAGVAGVLYGLNFSSFVAKKFDFNASISILVMVVLGGMGNLRGSVIAAVVLTVLPELLRGLDKYRMFIYALILILWMVFDLNTRLSNLGRTLAARLRRKGGARP